MDDNLLSPDEESRVDYLNTPDGGVGGPADAASFDAGRAKEQFGAGGASAKAKEGRKAVEIPKIVAVGEYYGQSWKGPVKADILTHRRQPDRSYSLLDLAPGATHIAMRMSNGDIVMLLAAHPEETNNERRDYRMTSVLMNQGISNQVKI